MSTGVESWGNPDQLGPLYPFVGTEVFLVVVAAAVWLVWHLVQVRAENRECEEAVDLYREIGLERVLAPDGAEVVERTHTAQEVTTTHDEKLPAATTAAAESTETA